MMSPISVRICDEAEGVEKVYQLQKPYAILGPGSGTDVALPRIENDKPRRFYLQSVDGGVIAVELGSNPVSAEAPATARWMRHNEPLRIGHYAVMAERQPPRGSNLPARQLPARSSHLANELTDDTWLYFVNGHSRTSRKSVRHLRETLTLIGRSRSCHLKLSHPRVSRFQCSVVRSGNEFWAVSLSRKNELRVNGHPVASSRLTVGDILSIGPFRMQLQQGTGPGSSPNLMVNGVKSTAPAVGLEGEQQLRRALSGQRSDCRLVQADSQEWDAVRCSSDSDVVSLVQQFTAVQQLLMAQSQQQASMLLHLIRNVQLSHENQRELLQEQISAIQGISDELQDWRAELEREAVAVPPRRIENQAVDAANQAAPPESAPPRVPKTAEEIRAHASLSERINFLERERKSIVQKIIRLLPGNSEI